MTLGNALGKEFSFVKGNYAIIVLSWILIDFAGEIPATYYALYVLKLGATETVLGIIGLMGFLALASMQFPGGYARALCRLSSTLLHHHGLSS